MMAKVAKQAVAKASKGSGNAQTIIQTEKQGWWQSLDPKQRRIISWVAIGLGISLIAAATIWLGTKFVKGKLSDAESGKTLGEDKHATWARQIWNALDNNGWGWGTDEELLRKTIIEIPSKEDYKKVEKSYKKQTKGGIMNNDIEADLKNTEWEEMLAIVNAKPEKARDAKKGAQIYDPHGWAKRINAAVNYQWLGLFWGTDEDAILAVAKEFPTRQAYFDTAQVYFDEYGVGMMEDLRGDLDDDEIQKLRRIVLSKPAK